MVAVSVDNGQNAPTGDVNGPDTEVMLDIEVAGAVAPGANIVVYFAPNTDAGFLDAISQAAMDTVNKPSVTLDQLGRGGVELDGPIAAVVQRRAAIGGGRGRDGVRRQRRQRFGPTAWRWTGPRRLPFVESVLAGLRRHQAAAQRQFDFERSRLERAGGERRRDRWRCEWDLPAPGLAGERQGACRRRIPAASRDAACPMWPATPIPQRRTRYKWMVKAWRSAEPVRLRRCGRD